MRRLESRGYVAATVARRFGTVATLYPYAVIDGLMPANPADAVTRPKVTWERQHRTVLRPLEFAAVLSAARIVRSERSRTGVPAGDAGPAGVPNVRR